jgi:hypothetical protein
LTLVWQTDNFTAERKTTVLLSTVRKSTMPMSELERKAAFKSAVTMKQTTMEKAARDEMGVSIHHLNEGLANRRVLSEAVEERFAAYIDRPRLEVFAERVEAVA